MSAMRTSELDGAAVFDTKLAEIDSMLARIEGLAVKLGDDPDGHVRRSAAELRAAFVTRAAIEAPVRRIRNGLVMLRRTNQDGTRRESRNRAHAVDHLEAVLHGQLLPMLRRVGFEV
jgi:hypothetical protein